MKVLITGTASGIGKGCAEFFLKENHEVYGFDKNISSIQHPKYKMCIRDRPHPEGPTKMMNSLSSISRLKSLTAWKPFG